MSRHKRPRGGQPGNQNARKHGFYADNLNEQELTDVRKLIDAEGMDPQLAVLRVKVQSALGSAPGNHRVLMEGAKLISDRCNSQYDLSIPERSALKKATRDILEAAVTGDINFTKRIVSKSLENALILQHELESTGHKSTENSQNQSRLSDITTHDFYNTNRISKTHLQND
jgi:hypothetical protein